MIVKRDWDIGRLFLPFSSLFLEVWFCNSILFLIFKYCSLDRIFFAFLPIYLCNYSLIFVTKSFFPEEDRLNAFLLVHLVLFLPLHFFLFELFDRRLVMAHYLSTFFSCFIWWGLCDYSINIPKLFLEGMEIAVYFLVSLSSGCFNSYIRESFRDASLRSVNIRAKPCVVLNGFICTAGGLLMCHRNYRKR